MSEIDRIREILTYDIDPEFLRAAGMALAWEYHLLYEQVKADSGIPIEIKKEEFSKRKSNCAVRVLVRTAQKHGIPFDFRKLGNGQLKLLLKIGRVVLIQETIATLLDEPQAAAYKIELADTHGLIRQLELDLGDQPQRILDWSGNVLGVLLHGAAGPAFSRKDRKLGAFMLAVPDAEYVSWVVRLDLSRLATEGIGVDIPAEKPPADRRPPVTQLDKVEVKLRRNKRRTGTEK